MRPVYYVTPDWPDQPGRLHGMLDPLSDVRRQQTLCGRSIQRWWRAASLPEDGDRPVCKHCGPAIILFLYNRLPPPPTGDSGQLRLPLLPPRPDLGCCA